MEPHIINIDYGINPENLSSVVEDAKDYAIYKGIAMRSRHVSDAVVHLPFCLVPSKFPARYFEHVCELQTHLNHILFSIAHSREILKECLCSTLEFDEFTKNIFKIFEAVDDLNRPEHMSLGLIRSDYLLDADKSGNIIGLKQVENNAIASSFGGLSPKIRDLHEFVLERLGQKNFHSQLPKNESLVALAKGLVSAWHMYGNSSAIVLFVVEDITYNICDQRALEYEIGGIVKDLKVLRYSFKELRTAAELKDDKLFVNDKEVAVVYYRTGYVPEQYEPEDWETRFLMERSRAINCPSAGLQLAATKRVQLYLTCEGILEKFVSADIAEQLRQVFARQYSLEMGQKGDEVVKLAIENPENYVLKPERDGGGNNLYGDDLKRTLEDIGFTEKRKAYILMEHINAPGIPNCIVISSKDPEISNIICELGIFGVILGNKIEVHKNNFAGHLLRSKSVHSNEAGIAAGFGALDSPYLE